MKKKSCAFSYTDFGIFTGSSNSPLRRVRCMDKYYLATLFSDMGIALSSVIYKRDENNLIRFANSGPYTEADLYLKLIALYGCGHRVPEELLKYRNHDSSMSGNKIKVFGVIFHLFNTKFKFNKVVSFMITVMIGVRSISRQIKKYFH